MSAFSRIFRATNWKYAVGEMTLVFVGITLALLANSWYEDSKNRKEEREILRQLFFSLLKRERVNRVSYRTRDEARADVFDYIERFYNRQRPHGYLGHTSPVLYEERDMRT